VTRFTSLSDAADNKSVRIQVEQEKIFLKATIGATAAKAHFVRTL